MAVILYVLAHHCGGAEKETPTVNAKFDVFGAPLQAAVDNTALYDGFGGDACVLTGGRPGGPGVPAVIRRCIEFLELRGTARGVHWQRC